MRFQRAACCRRLEVLRCDHAFGICFSCFDSNAKSVDNHWLGVLQSNLQTCCAGLFPGQRSSEETPQKACGLLRICTPQMIPPSKVSSDKTACSLGPAHIHNVMHSKHEKMQLVLRWVSSVTVLTQRPGSMFEELWLKMQTATSFRHCMISLQLAPCPVPHQAPQRRHQTMMPRVSIWASGELQPEPEFR